MLAPPMPIVVVGDKLGRTADLMNEVVCIIDDTATVEQAREELAGSHVTGAPVVRGEAIVGIVSQTDLLNASGDRPIHEVMTKTVYAVRPADPVMLAVRLMAEQRIHRVIVVDDGGDLQGILSAMDVLTAMSKAAADTSELSYVKLGEDE